MRSAALFLVALWAAPQDAGVSKGIAAKYPGDAGLEHDPDVLLVESFESDSWLKTWQEISHPERKEIETDPGIALVGRRCLRLPVTPEGKETAAGWMHYWWEGSQEVYLRYYFRLSKGGDWRNNKLLQLHGHPAGERYGPGAGKKPTGFDTISSGTGVGGDQGPPWTRVMLYTYWPHQQGPWGDNVLPNRGVEPKINEEEWTCYEVMVKLNDVGRENGEQRLWINGRLVVEQTGMEWRKTDKLVINNIMLSTYTSEPPRPGTRRTVWIDGVVLARRYIGPMEPEKPK
jgi:hypothetical protein